MRGNDGVEAQADPFPSKDGGGNSIQFAFKAGPTYQFTFSETIYELKYIQPSLNFAVLFSSQINTYRIVHMKMHLL